MTARAAREVWPELERAVALQRVRFTSNPLGEKREGIEIVLPAHVVEVAAPVLPEKVERWWRRFSLLTILFTFAIAVVLGVLTYWSYHVTLQSAADAVVRADVLAAAQALQEMPDGLDFQLMIRGPGFLPDGRGTRVSEGTTLFLERRSDGMVYVRGSRRDGTTTYFVHEGVLYQSSSPSEEVS